MSDSSMGESQQLLDHESTESHKTTKSVIPIVLATSTACNYSYPHPHQQEHVASSSCDTFKVRDRSLTQVSQVRGHSTESRLSTQCKIREPCATRGTLCCSSDPTFSPSPGRGLGPHNSQQENNTRRCSERTLTLNIRLPGEEDGHNT